jgi:hypothetical protein
MKKRSQSHPTGCKPYDELHTDEHMKLKEAAARHVKVYILLMALPFHFLRK